jgi:hypothetical protein
MLSNHELEAFVRRVRGARQDILNELILFRNATGEVREAYKLVLTDKLWKLSRLTGEFNLKMLKEVSDIETSLGKDLHTEKSEEQTKADLNKEYEEWREIMETELKAERAESERQLAEGVKIARVGV